MRPIFPSFAAITLGAALPALAAPPTIDELAPPESYLIARIHDATEMRGDFDATPMGALMEDPQVERWIDGLLDEMTERMELPLEELGMDREDVPWPSGHVGFAVWTAEGAPLSASKYLLAADFADEAEAFVDFIVELAEDARERDGGFEITWDDYGPYEVMTTTSIVDEAAAEQRREQLDQLRDDEMWQDADIERLEAMIDEELTPVTLHLSRAGDLVLVSNDLPRLRDALDRADDREIEAVAGAEFLARARAHHEGAQMDVVFRTDRVLSQFMDEVGEMGMFFIPPAILEPLGLRDMGAMAMGLRVDSPAGQMDLTYSLELDERRGLFSLPVDVAEFEPPAFVAPSAASVSTFGMDFTQILPIAQEMIQAFPAEQRAEFEGMVTAFAVAAAPIFQSIGPEIYTVTSYDEPLAADSMRQLIAIKVSNEPAVIAALNQYAQGLGARVRDFLGHQIWETPAMLGQQFAVGVGAGWAFYGLPVDVENAFRQLQADDPQTIADNPSFDTATDRLRRGGLGYQWADTGAWLEFAKWQAENVEEVVRAQFAGGGFGGPGWQPDEEFMDFMIEQARNQPLNVLLRDAPPVDVLIGAIGDQIADYRWEDGAMVGRWIMLRPVR